MKRRAFPKVAAPPPVPVEEYEEADAAASADTTITTPIM